MNSPSSEKPWRRTNPKKKPDRVVLTPESIALAKAAAKRAGRRYPNLIDNMNAARMQREREEGKASGSAAKTRRQEGPG